MTFYKFILKNNNYRYKIQIYILIIFVTKDHELSLRDFNAFLVIIYNTYFIESVTFIYLVLNFNLLILVSTDSIFLN